MTKSEKVLLISNIILCGFFIAVIFHYINAHLFYVSYPFNSLLDDPKKFVDDIRYITAASINLKPYSTANSMVNYFPLIHFLLYPFSLIKNIYIVYAIFLTTFLGFFLYKNGKSFWCKDISKIQNIKNIFILSLMTGPFLYLVEKSNIDMFLLILLSFSIYSFIEKRFLSSAISLAIINAIKPYSIVFLVLFLFKKKWKEFFISIFLTFFLVLFGFLLLHDNPFVQFSGFLTNLMLFKQEHLYSLLNGTTNCAGLFQALKLFLYYNPFVSKYFLVTAYGFLIFFSLIITIYFAWREPVFWKKIAFLTLYLSTFPYIVFEYKLIFIFIPLWLFVNNQTVSRFDKIYTVLFGLLLMPKKQFIFNYWIPISTFAYPIIILLFMGLLIYDQYSSKKISKHKDL